MKQVYCEREAEILEALRRGGLGPELVTHAATCAICADTLAVSEFFQTDKDKSDAPHQFCYSEALFAAEESGLNLNMSTVDPRTQFCTHLPNPDFLWWKAQLERKQIALERATRSIALVRKGSYLGAAAAGLWLVFSPSPLGSILSVVSKHEIWPTGALTYGAMFLGVAALVFTLLGSLYLVHSEK